MNDVIITGATGFIGSNLCRQLSKNKTDVHIFTTSKSNFWRLNDIITKIHVHTVDLVKHSQVQKKILEINPKYIFHCASYGVHPKELIFQKMVNVNINGTRNLLDATSELSNFKKFINLSSYFEYSHKQDKLKESDLTQPITLYGISKLLQTNLVRYYSLKKNIPSVNLRIFTPYGKFDEPGRLINSIMLSIINKKNIILFSKNSKRDFIHVDDVISALIHSAKSKFSNSEIFNIGSGNSYSVEKIVNLCKKLINDSNTKIIWKIKHREFDLLGGGGYSDNTKTIKNLNWKPKISLEAGLQMSHKWYKMNHGLYKNN